jgi:hypothetical protein
MSSSVLLYEVMTPFSSVSAVSAELTTLKGVLASICCTTARVNCCSSPWRLLSR